MSQSVHPPVQAFDRVIDGRGATLLPGLIESHSHLSFADVALSTDLGYIAPEEHTLLTARHARTVSLRA